MNKVYIVFAHEVEPFFALARMLQNLKGSLASSGFQYQWHHDFFWQIDSLYDLSAQFVYLVEQSKQPGTEKLIESTNRIINGYLKRFADSIEPNKNILWLLGRTNIGSYAVLKESLAKHPLLADRKIHGILVAQHHIDILKQWITRSWKQTQPKELYEQMSVPGKFYYYDDAYQEMEKQFDSVSVLINQGDTANSGPKLWHDLGKILNIDMPDCFKLAPYPKSYAGLDIARGVFDFPFTFFNKQVFDRNKFYELVEHIENEEGFERANINLAREAGLLAEKFGPQNEKLAKRLGIDRLFQPAAEEGGGITFDALPVITPVQCRPFVAAMKEEFRASLMRFFRDRDVELVPEEIVLAKSLEEYRKKFTPVSVFFFPREEPLLSVLTMTRNHENYILDCMESVSAQKTDFPVEHIIVDDCSDDGTQEIIEEYASKNPHVRPFYLPYRSYGGMNIRKLFNACKSKYAALCDGDDYFINPNKLQKQVDFLETNQDCGLCFHPVLAKYENDAHPSFIYPPANALPRGVKKKYYLADLFNGNMIQTNSVVYRWRFRKGLPEWFRSDICPSDWYWHILHAEMGKIGFIPVIMSVYRRHPASWYADSFVTPIENRRKHGMSELETYKVMNNHLKNRYFNRISGMAGSVFADFLTIQKNEGDSSLINAAIEKYPDFALDFMKRLNVIRKENPKTSLNEIIGNK